MGEAEQSSDHTEVSVASDVSARIQSIIASAEEAATAIREEARRDVETLRDDARREVEALREATRSEVETLRTEARHEAEASSRAVETEALRRLNEANREADALVEQRLQRIAELSDSILERAAGVVDRLEAAEGVRRQLDSLVQALGHTAERVAREATGEVGPLPQTRPAVAESGAETPREPETADEPPADEDTSEPLSAAQKPSPPRVASAAPVEDRSSRSSSVVELRPAPAPQTAQADDDQLGAARLVALQMAVSGSSRGDVAVHLSREFAMKDPHEILDEVFGAGFPETETSPTGRAE